MDAFCSTSSTLVPAALISAMMSRICATMSGASPSDGSSSNRSFGDAIIARPIASICCSPPDRYPAVLVRRSASRGNNASTFS